MSLITKVEFAKLKKVSLAAVNKWIKLGKYEVVTLDDDRQYIKYDIREDLTNSDTNLEIMEKKEATGNYNTDSLDVSFDVNQLVNHIAEKLDFSNKGLQKSLIEDFKNHILDLLREDLTTKENEILKDENNLLKNKIDSLTDEINKMKDDEIERLRSKSFFKRLFGD